MEINATGWEDEEERRLIENYVRYCVEDQLPDISRDPIQLVIDVIADHNLVAERRWGETQLCGWFNITPTYFRLRLRRSGMSFHNQLKVAGHECVHIGQYRRLELEHLQDGIFRWKGAVVDSHSFKDWYEPWELDARGLEKGLLENFIRDVLGYEDDVRPGWYVDAP